MCTISWLPTPDGYSLRMNRDELLSRAPAMGPRVLRLGGEAAIAPLDTESGGAWIGVTARGMGLTLANLYPEPPTAPLSDPVSRGLLLMDALALRSGGEAIDHLRSRDLGVFRPFRLSVFEPGQAARSALWNGQSLSFSATDRGGLVATSSSRDQEGADRIRRQLFDRVERTCGGFTEELLDELHRSREPEPGPYAISMERSDAATLSMSHVAVDARHVTFSYTPGPPHETDPLPALRIERVHEDASPTPGRPGTQSQAT